MFSFFHFSMNLCMCLFYWRVHSKHRNCSCKCNFVVFGSFFFNWLLALVSWLCGILQFAANQEIKTMNGLNGVSNGHSVANNGSSEIKEKSKSSSSNSHHHKSSSKDKHRDKDREHKSSKSGHSHSSSSKWVLWQFLFFCAIVCLFNAPSGRRVFVVI